MTKALPCCWTLGRNGCSEDRTVSVSTDDWPFCNGLETCLIRRVLGWTAILHSIVSPWLWPSFLSGGREDMTLVELLWFFITVSTWSANWWSCSVIIGCNVFLWRCSSMTFCIAAVSFGVLSRLLVWISSRIMISCLSFTATVCLIFTVTVESQTSCARLVKVRMIVALWEVSRVVGWLVELSVSVCRFSVNSGP